MHYKVSDDLIKGHIILHYSYMCTFKILDLYVGFTFVRFIESPVNVKELYFMNKEFYMSKAVFKNFGKTTKDI